MALRSSSPPQSDLQHRSFRRFARFGQIARAWREIRRLRAAQLAPKLMAGLPTYYSTYFAATCG